MRATATPRLLPAPVLVRHLRAAVVATLWACAGACGRMVFEPTTAAPRPGVPGERVPSGEYALPVR